MPQVQFKAKPQRGHWYDTSGETPRVLYDVPKVYVPKLKRSHCDASAFRASRCRLGQYYNSDLFLGLLTRRLAELGIGPQLRLDALPPCVTVDTSGFLAVVTINV